MYKRKRIVIALGGNALGNTLPEQMMAVKTTAKALCDLIEDGHQVVVVHGNGPQVGMINNAMAALSREDALSLIHISQEGQLHTEISPPSGFQDSGSNPSQCPLESSSFKGSSFCSSSSSSSSTVYEFPQYSQAIFCVLLLNSRPAEQLGHL